MKLKLAVSDARSTLSNNEKAGGKWSKDDRSKVTALCNEKSDWLEKRTIRETALEDLHQQQEEFEQKLEPLLDKLTAGV